MTGQQKNGHLTIGSSGQRTAVAELALYALKNIEDEICHLGL